MAEFAAIQNDLEVAQSSVPHTITSSTTYLSPNEGYAPFQGLFRSLADQNHIDSHQIIYPADDNAQVTSTLHLRQHLSNGCLLFILYLAHNVCAVRRCYLLLLTCVTEEWAATTHRFQILATTCYHSQLPQHDLSRLPADPICAGPSSQALLLHLHPHFAHEASQTDHGQALCHPSTAGYYGSGRSTNHNVRYSTMGWDPHISVEERMHHGCTGVPSPCVYEGEHRA